MRGLPLIENADKSIAREEFESRAVARGLMNAVILVVPFYGVVASICLFMIK